MEKKFKRVGNYLIDTSSPLGKGSFGIVYLGCHALTSVRVAAKVLDQHSINSSPKSSKIIESISREVIILQTVKHPNIVRLLDQYITSHNYYLIFEYCGDGDLASYRLKNTNNGFFSEREAVIFFNNILSGLVHLHSNHIIHRDLKPSNILLNSSVLKIADFGLSRFCEVNQFMTEAGTPLYMAPEIFETGLYGKSCDIWSLGVLFYELLYGNVPWKSKKKEELRLEVKDGFKFPEYPKRDNRLKEIISRMIVYDMNQRITLEELANLEVLNLFNGFGKMTKCGILEDELNLSMIINSHQLGKRLVQGNLADNFSESTQPCIQMEMEFERTDEWETYRGDIRRESSNFKREPLSSAKSFEDEKKNREIEKEMKGTILFERNAGFFIKAACQTLVECYGSGKLGINEDFLYQIVFTLQKLIIFKMKYHVLAPMFEMGAKLDAGGGELNLNLDEGLLEEKFRKEKTGGSSITKIKEGEIQENKDLKNDRDTTAINGYNEPRVKERNEIELLNLAMERDFRDCYTIFAQMENLVRAREDVWMKKKNWGAFQIVLNSKMLQADFVLAYNEIMKEWKKFAKQDYRSKKSTDRDYLRMLLFMGICIEFRGVEKFFSVDGGDKENAFYRFYEEVEYMCEKEMKKRVEMILKKANNK